MSEKFAAGMKVIEEVFGEAVVSSLKASANSPKLASAGRWRWELLQPP